MEVASVGASGAYSNPVQAARPQTAQESQQVERREAPPEQVAEQRDEGQGRPVANAQGQMTGTLINVTA